VNDWGYVVAGWGITAVVLVGYALWIILRGRALSKQVPPEDRRWM
jgi:heme exporter protein CcmD